MEPVWGSEQKAEGTERMGARPAYWEILMKQLRHVQWTRYHGCNYNNHVMAWNWVHICRRLSSGMKGSQAGKHHGHIWSYNPKSASL